jgi:hypothetical protein
VEALGGLVGGGILLWVDLTGWVRVWGVFDGETVPLLVRDVRLSEKGGSRVTRITHPS